jgi:hypothetical protein
VSVSWESVLQAVILILIPSIGFLLKVSINRVLRQGDEVEKKLEELNGSVREIKVWQGMHEGQDNERHRENLSRFDAIVRELDRVAARLQRLG